MARFSCPYLKGEVDLTEERERHIAQRHPDPLPEHRDRMVETWPILMKFVGASVVLSCFLAGIMISRKESTSLW